MKQTWKPGTMLAPLPPALISSGDMDCKNVMTAAWTGIICSDPVITYVSIRPSRYTHELISKNKEFVINVPTWKIAQAVDMVGVKSGRDGDKFALAGLTAEASSVVKAPQIAECPVSIECKVLEVRPFGTHDMFLAEVLAVNVDEAFIDESGALDLEKAGLLAYAHGFYYTLGRKIGKFGFSVEKKKQKAAVDVVTLVKADKKFNQEKAEKKFTKAVKESFTENGAHVITVKKPRFVKSKPIADMIKEKPARGSRKRTVSAKFARKGNKTTDFKPVSFRKKADGSFRKKREL